MLRNKIYLVILTLSVVLSVLTGCTNKTEVKVDPKGMSYYDFFDTVSFIYSYTTDDDETFKEKCNAIAGILQEYHRMFDIYHEYDGINNLYTVNKNAGIQPVEVDERLIEFLSLGKELYARTNGKMNIMIGALTKPWHDCRTNASDNPESAKLPDEDLLLEANKHVDIDLLVIDKDNNTVYITDPEARLDVGAFGKGYATERAADYLFSINSTGYVLNIGGNIRIIGTRLDGTGWVTGIVNPADTTEFAMRINIKNIACVTSGDYERYFVVDGKKYHHVIDPVTLYPAQYFASVTIITDDSGLADAYSTAFYCMNYEEGIKLAEKLGIDVVWIFKDGDVKYTKNVENLIY